MNIRAQTRKFIDFTREFFSKTSKKEPFKMSKMKGFWHYLRYFWYLSVIFFFLTVILAVSFFFWVVEAPRDITFLNRYFTSLFAVTSSDLEFEIEKSSVKWNEKNKVLEFKIHNFLARNSNDEFKAVFPNAEIDLSVKNLVNFDNNIFDIYLENGDIKLILNDNKQNNIKNLASLGEFFRNIILSDLLLPINNITVNKVNIDVAQGNVTKNIVIDSVSIVKGFENDEKTTSATINTTFEGESLPFYLKSKISKLGTTDITTKFYNWPSYLVTDFLPDKPEYKLFKNRQNYLIFSGAFNAYYDKNNKPQKIELQIKHATGVISWPEYFENPIKVNHLGFVSAYKPQQEVYNLYTLTANIDEGYVLKLDGNFNADNKDVILNGSTKNFKIDSLKNYWPHNLASAPKKWVVESISKGVVENAEIHVRSNLKDFENERFKDNAIDVTLTTKGVQVKYNNELPAAQGVSAKVKFNNKDIEIFADFGHIVESTIAETYVKVPYLGNIEDRPIIIKGKVLGYTNNFADFIPRAIVESAKESGFPLNKMEGYAKTQVNIIIPHHQNDIEYNDIKFDISSQLMGAKIIGVLGRFDITYANGSVNFNGDSIKIDTVARINDSPAHIIWQSDFSKKSSAVSKGIISASIVPDSSSKIGFGKDLILKAGEIPINFNINIADGKKNIAFNADFSKANIVYPMLDIDKPVGSQAKLTADIKIDENEAVLDSLIVQGKNIDIEGNLRFSNDFSKLQQLTFNKFIYADKNNFSISYNVNGNAKTIKINGKKLSMSEFKLKKLFEGDKSKEKTSEDIAINISSLKLNDSVLHNFSLHFNCGITSCNSLNLNTNIDNGENFSIATTPQNGSLLINLHSDDFGKLLDILGIYGSLRQGKANLTGLFDKDGTGNFTFSGDLAVENINAYKTPFLTKLLALTSITGIIDTISGKDLRFDKFTSKIILNNQIVSIKEGRAKGDALGFTIEGNINLDKKEMKLSGTVIPSMLGVNSFLSNVPIIGTIVTGGKDGGIIGANYTISGPVDDVSIYVNPLSVLTPGILRNIFNVF